MGHGNPVFGSGNVPHTLQPGFPASGFGAHGFGGPQTPGGTGYPHSPHGSRTFTGLFLTKTYKLTPAVAQSEGPGNGAAFTLELPVQAGGPRREEAQPL